MGVAPNDIVPFIIQGRANVQYRWIRIGLDAAYLIAGFILGGTIGVGTILALASTGPFIQFCLPHGEKLVKLIVKENNEENQQESAIITA